MALWNARPSITSDMGTGIGAMTHLNRSARATDHRPWSTPIKRTGTFSRGRPQLYQARTVHAYERAGRAIVGRVARHPRPKPSCIVSELLNVTACPPSS